ncbi:MAG TPA: rRNA maturation RNase YbeY [Candidatus Limnocylindrales bacterium]|nr:rRNA maturation RNase YbeY [Candidatus Limnocylindrales bacterium]
MGVEPGRASVERRLYLPPWRVDVTGVPRIVSSAALARVIAAALAAAGAPSPSSIGLILADDAELAELNAIHMGQTGPTDVLSFPLLEPDAYPLHEGSTPPPEAHRSASFRLPPGRRPHLGDIVVSVERAIAQAEAGTGGQTADVRWSPADELRLLVVHGALHVCGWDHADPVEAAAMRSLERDILSPGHRERSG